MLKTEEELVFLNDLIFLNGIAEKMWSYHPENPNQIDVEGEYDSIMEEITTIEGKMIDLRLGDCL